MTDPETDRIKDDEILERQFALDYAAFGLKINFTAIVAMLEKARSTADLISRKSLCLSGMQLLFSSYEDFALLLHAFRKRRDENIHIHLSLGTEKQSKQGSTFVPRLFKNYESARQVLDNLGFTSITFESMQKNYMDISERQFEEHFKDFADSIKQLGEYQESFNDIKNRLKHGKAVFEGDVQRKYPSHIIYLEWNETDSDWELHLHRFDASIEQMEVAITHIAKIYIRALQLLWLFTLQYHSGYADTFVEIMKRESLSCIKQVEALGIKSEGLTDIAK